MQLAAGGDAELGEYPVQVVADRPVRDLNSCWPISRLDSPSAAILAI